MSGFEHRPLTTIKRIVSDLRDRYQSGFSIIKEIIQNADDSNSERLDFGWSKELLNAQHPLLKGPSVFFINDGKFKRSDAEAIRRFGDSEKEGEQAAIGKFGLGQKSIFHLCEAFFYLAYSPDEEFDSRFPACNFLNPWAEANPQPNELADPFHPNWEEFSEADQKCVKDHFKDILGQENYKPHFFILWIPLRKESHRKRKTKEGEEDEVGVIMKEFPGDQKTPPNEIFPANLASEIGILLPLLRSLKEVSYWLPNSKAKLQAQFHLILQGSRRHYPLKNAEKPHEICGSVQISHFDHEDNNTLAFSGYEIILNSRTLTNIRKHRNWPTSIRIDSKTGKPIQEPDKAFAHSAVTFIQKQAEQKGKLSIQWAVFLPLGDPSESPNEEVQYEGDKDYVVLLHGYFFVDAGRRHIEWKNSIDSTGELTDEAIEAEVRQTWNQLLITQGTLKNVLPALNLFVKKHNPAPENIWALSYALKNSDLFQKYVNDICHKHQWVYGYAVDEQEWQWQYIDAKKPLLAIPQPDTDKTSLLAWEVLPNLESESLQDCLITLIDAPNLSISSSDWSENQLETVLQDIHVFSVFKNQQRLEYLLDFLRLCANSLCDEKIIQDRLCDIARQAFARFNANKLYQFKELMIAFLNFIPEKCFFIECKTYQAKIFLALHKLDTHAILIPRLSKIWEKSENYFDLSAIQTTPKQELSEGEALIILKKLNTLIQKEEYQDIVDDCADIARQILLLVVDKKSFVKKHPDLRVLRAHNCRTSQDKTTTVSLKDIISAYQKGTLFRHKPGLSNVQDKREFANPLQSVLADATVIIIEKAVVDLLSDIVEENKIVPCDSAGCLMALSQAPSLNHRIEDRAELLQELLDSNIEAGIFTKGIRYLLTLKIEYDLDDKPALWYLSDVEKHKSFVEAILTARAETTYLINDVFVSSVKDNLAPAKQDLIGIEELASIKAIELALSYKEPHKLYKNILDALQYVDIKSLSDSEKQQLRQKAWLIDKDGTPIKPEDVVYLPEIKDTVKGIIDKLTHPDYLDYLRLEQEIQHHASFQKLCDLPTFAAGSEGLVILGFIMNENEKYRLGDFTNDTFPFRKCLTVFRDITSEHLPAWAVIRIAEKQYSEVVQSLLGELFGQMPTKRLVKLLLWLKEQHANFPTNRTSILEVFNSYLKMAVADEHFNDIFRKIPLLSRAGKWKSPSKLSLEAQNIDENDLLDHTQGNILRHHIKNTVQKNTANSSKADVVDKGNIIYFEPYFAKWTDKINHELIGIFLALLGDAVLSGDRKSGDSINTSFISQLAQDYLGKHHSVESVRKNLNIDNTDHFSVRINVTQQKSGQVKLTALDGDRFEADLCETADSIFIDHDSREFDDICSTFLVTIENTDYQIDISKRKKWIALCLLEIDTERQYDSKSLSNLLKAATAKVLECLYNQQNTDALEQLWEKFSQPEQLDIGTARQWILKSAFFYLPQLNYTGYDFRQLLKEREKLDSPQDSLDAKAYYQKEQSLITKLGELIESKQEEQNSILEAIRTKIASNYQYNHQSVPFELFQNADDSVVELEEMSCQLEQSQRFTLSWNDTTLTVTHWGRPINLFRYRDFSADEGRERGFDHDLKKMLVLNSGSDKNEKVTGKFGLGFKSVFLICKQPRILSGHPTILSKQLGFQIIAGLLPIPLPDEERTKLLTSLRNKTPDNSPVGTLIELAIDDGTPNDIVDSFKKVVAVLLVFAKRIKNCDLDSKSGNHSVTWQPEEIIKEVYVGDLKLDIEQDEPSTVLVIQNQNKEGILMRLGSQGVEKLPEHIPDIWVTTPLKESMGFHFALNGRFDIDIGRAQLALHSENNQEVTKRLCGFIGQKLCDLFKKSQESDFNFNEKLGLSAELSNYDFWYSMWKLLGDSGIKNNESSKLGDFIFFRQLLDKHPAFPTGLSGGYQVLTHFNEIKFVANGVIQGKVYFEQVATWDKFKSSIAPGTIISNKQWTILKTLVPEEKPVPHYLADAINLEMGESKFKVSPKLAKQLGQLISCDFLDKLDEQHKEDYKRLSDVLGKACFQAKDGKSHLASKLCEPKQTSDDFKESEQAALAFSKVLASDYTDEAVTFFQACRRQYEMTKLSEMAEQYSIPTLQSLVKEDEENRERKNSDRERKAINKKIGENVELIIRKILRDKGLKIKTIDFGGDLEIWPEENVGCDCCQIKISSKITMEVKFTSGSEVHLTQRQSKTAREWKSQYIVLVVKGDGYGELRGRLNVDIEENSVQEDLENVIKANSHVVKELYEKLGQLPNPIEIEPDIHGYRLKKPLWENDENIVTWLENEF